LDRFLKYTAPAGVGLPFILLAARGNRTGALAALLKCPGVDVNVQDCEGRTILFESQYYVKRVQTDLHDRGIDVNIQDFQGNTAFMNAVLSGDLSFIRHIRSFSSDPTLTNINGQALRDLINDLLRNPEQPLSSDPDDYLLRLDKAISEHVQALGNHRARFADMF
jgi:ankyrin repeat protein